MTRNISIFFPMTQKFKTTMSCDLYIVIPLSAGCPIILCPLIIWSQSVLFIWLFELHTLLLIFCSCLAQVFSTLLFKRLRRIYIRYWRINRFAWRSRVLLYALWYFFLYLLIFWLPEIVQIDQVYHITVFKLTILY